MARSSPAKGHAILPRMPDGVAVAARRHDPHGRIAALALLVPDLGEDADAFDGSAALLAAHDVRAFCVSHRGHGASAGTWSLGAQLRDYRAWLWTMQQEAARIAKGKTRLPVLVVARGLSATLALLHEEIAHRHPAHRRPAIPDAMVLLDPVVRGSQRARGGLLGLFGAPFGACRGIPRAERDALRRFRLPPVRAQTPTAIVVSGSLHATHEHDPLKLVFGNARVRRGTWLRPTTRAGQARFDTEIALLCAELLATDRPHRFRVSV